MKTIILHKTIRLIPLMAAIAVAGCVTAEDKCFEDGQVSLLSVSAQLGSASDQSITRAVDLNDPTLTSLVDRSQEGHMLMITLAESSEMYQFDGSKFVPTAEPLYYSDSEATDINFWFGDQGGTIADQDGTVEKLLSADALTATLKIAPAPHIDGVTLTHANSLIDLTFASGVDVDQISDLKIGDVAAYNNNNNNDVFMAIIEPGSDNFEVTLTYKGVDGYKIVIDKESVSDGKEFAPNYRYSLMLDVNEINFNLTIQAISIAPWADDGTVLEAAQGITSIILNSSYYASEKIAISFTDGSSISADVAADGKCEIRISDPVSPKTIFSIARMDTSGLYDLYEVLIGRVEGENITLDFDDAGNLKFRPADASGYIPIGTYSEFAMINTDTVSLSGLYLQEADLDLLGFPVNDEDWLKQNWLPIGNTDDYFTGTYDGGGYKINNLYLKNNDDSSQVDPENPDLKTFGGLFGICMNSSLKNIHIASGSIQGSNFLGSVCAGFMSDQEGMSEISNCTNYAKVSGYAVIGGICGTYMITPNCSGTISNCVNFGEIEGSCSIGGICGSFTGSDNSACTLAECTNNGLITHLTGDDNYSIGGIIGYNAFGTIVDCCNNQNINGNGDLVGGICGYNFGELKSCSNSAQITGNDQIGGICGGNEESIVHCYNIGEVNGNMDIGGICGYSADRDESTIVECYSATKVSGDSNVGGVCGTNDGTIVYCFWGVARSNDTSPNTAVGNGNAGTSYNFSDSNWPGVISTPGYWNQDANGDSDPNGFWESLGVWAGTPENSTYPTLKKQTP